MSHSSSVGSFEHDSTDAEDDFQLIDPNTSAALSLTQRAPSSTSTPTSTSISSSTPLLPASTSHPPPVPLSQSTGSLPSRPPARRRRKKIPDDASHSTSSLPHPPTSASSTPPPSLPLTSDPSTWGLRSHIAGYADRNWAVQPHQSGEPSLPAHPTDPDLAPASDSIDHSASAVLGSSVVGLRADGLASSLGSSWSGSIRVGGGGGVGGTGMEYEEGEEMEEVSEEGFDDEGAQFPQSSVTSLQPSISDVEEGRDSEVEDRATEASGKEDKRDETAATSAWPVPAAVAPASSGSSRPASPLLPQRALPLFTSPAVLSYAALTRQQQLQQAANGGAASDQSSSTSTSASSASSSSSSSSSSFSSSLPVIPLPSKADADTVPLPYFPWLSPRTLRHVGYAAVGLFVFVSLVRFGVMHYGKVVAFQVPS